jgi:DNA repair protein RecO (recombination protein O)
MITKAIIIKKQNTNEFDQWVVCYTEEFGKLKTIAKSILKPNSIQAHHLDMFNLVEFELVNGRGLPIITSAQVINSFLNLKNQFIKIAVASFFAEVIDKMVFENDQDKNLWSFLVFIMEELNKKETYPLKLMRQGQLKLLEILGYFPETDFCKVCDDKLGELNFSAFNFVLGGIICKKCFLVGQEGVLINKNDFNLIKRGDINFQEKKYTKSILDGMFEYIYGARFTSLDLLNMIK